MQVTILTGGLGTRLRGNIPDGTPKSMAMVGDRPFLEFVLSHALNEGASSFLFLTGYAADPISKHFGQSYRNVPISYSREDRPQGTGGALRVAEDQLHERFVLVNGDTFVDVDFRELLRQATPLSMATIVVKDTERFGRLEIIDGRIVRMSEKGISGPGTINAGAYGIHKSLLSELSGPAPLSFEKDLLEPRLTSISPLSVPGRGRFIDIGVPEDLQVARSDPSFLGF